MPIWRVDFITRYRRALRYSALRCRRRVMLRERVIVNGVPDTLLRLYVDYTPYWRRVLRGDDARDEARAAAARVDAGA